MCDKLDQSWLGTRSIPRVSKEVCRNNFARETENYTRRTFGGVATVFFLTMATLVSAPGAFGLSLEVGNSGSQFAGICGVRTVGSLVNINTNPGDSVSDFSFTYNYDPNAL